MKIIVFGGTSEGRELSYQLAADKHEVIVCVATEYGREEQGSCPGIWVLCGRKNTESMMNLISNCDLCIDATHPYAIEATRNILTACKAVQIPCVRYQRPATGVEPDPENQDLIFVDSAAEAAAYLADTEGNILLTTGVKDLPAYKELDVTRLYPRVLPLHTSLDMCESLEIPHRNILALQGPFCQSLNEAMMEQHSIRFMVTKNSGSAGGFLEKIHACRNKQAALIVIGRNQIEMEEQAEYLFETQKEVLDFCKTYENNRQEEQA